jgi:hypothetical protein
MSGQLATANLITVHVEVTQNRRHIGKLHAKSTNLPSRNVRRALHLGANFGPTRARRGIKLDAKAFNSSLHVIFKSLLHSDLDH